jgi:hypothetical protein
MSQSEITVLAKALSYASSSTLVTTSVTGRSSAAKAIKRCCTAWQRAYNAAANKGQDGYDAKEAASNAYRNAMPVLAGYDGIRDFIACAAHGILVDAIPEEKSGQLFYAAQVAISSLSREPKSSKKP